VNLGIEISIFDPCLYITKNSEFGLVGMQTDDMLILAGKGFIEKEDKQLHKANIQAKPIEAISSDNLLLFNRCKFSYNKDSNSLYLS
jgi:hypothetical protein